MSKSVFMQLEMAAGLRASFQHAAAREHRPAAQVLQQLMREYVVRQSCVDAEGEAGAVHPAERAAGAVALERPVAAAPVLEPAPCFASDDRDLEAIAARQHGWRCSPFGMG
ncbi:hypothetical protein KQ945_14325 [Bacillus subtilis subsp. subtilis]|nr:hypothetical protein [Bacillus subtilis subsp. subtilis]